MGAAGIAGWATRGLEGLENIFGVHGEEGRCGRVYMMEGDLGRGQMVAVEEGTWGPDWAGEGGHACTWLVAPMSPDIPTRCQRVGGCELGLRNFHPCEIETSTLTSHV